MFDTSRCVSSVVVWSLFVKKSKYSSISVVGEVSDEEGCSSGVLCIVCLLWLVAGMLVILFECPSAGVI